ncbi:hypothetical protein AB0F81_33415 [Actinoplanes sp. NPDC024001]|uniref:hypothetical protein n=1 Tax=Actinoplanes sp. NPDC024001 TaxID=3154598 RepID=UPI00340A0E05
MTATEPNEDVKRTAHRALVERLLHGPGTTSAEQRAAAFHNAAGAPASALVDRVATAPTRITDADFSAAVAAGLSDDQIFELVVCAAVGQAGRQYEAGLAALAEAAGGERGDR